MSILIKGAKMPKSCDECDFIAYDDEYEYECWCPIIRSNVEEYTENKPARCPLVEVPSADVVGVKHGRWNECVSLMGKSICSNCHLYWIDTDSQYDFNYCPRCGARMDGKEQDNE